MPVTGLLPAGLPHSDIHGSRDICSSPWLFAAYRVLRRLREPRHPPSALAYFLLAALFVRVDISQARSARFLLVLSTLDVQHVKDLFLVENCITTYVENNGFEPLTLCLQSRCSSQLS